MEFNLDQVKGVLPKDSQSYTFLSEFHPEKNFNAENVTSLANQEFPEWAIPKDNELKPWEEKIPSIGDVSTDDPDFKIPTFADYSSIDQLKLIKDAHKIYNKHGGKGVMGHVFNKFIAPGIINKNKNVHDLGYDIGSQTMNYSPNKNLSFNLGPDRISKSGAGHGVRFGFDYKF